jgi:hypothetical protein
LYHNTISIFTGNPNIRGSQKKPEKLSSLPESQMRNFTHDDNMIELPHLGIHFSVAEVYEKTTFDESFAEE